MLVLDCGHGEQGGEHDPSMNIPLSCKIRVLELLTVQKADLHV